MYGNPPLVGDVMTRKVVALTPDAAFKDIVRAMRQWKVSALPVLEDGNKVVGIVSEADLLLKEQFRGGDPLRSLPRARSADEAPVPQPDRLSDLAKIGAVTAEELMTTPAVTVPENTPVAQAARIMAHARIKRLPVVGDNRTLLGIVSRSDLLRVFERNDEDIAQEIRHKVVAHLFPAPLEPIRVQVRDGVVHLTGRVRNTALVPVAAWLAYGVWGVVDVDCALTGPPRHQELDPGFAEEPTTRSGGAKNTV
ncbi:CBS domain-containing protein [Streptomyces minutiscleroticus]|uniref:CBS domain-containing protein n=1 Tax=Streptomyces minutiscleroticus TaxID=68238 RepID=A0A918KMY1_9ACTN|nr:CBS domain-containing protein [Streptomyces minutiscleroticus]GGX69083.1 hypothetical protein GCM10010358_24320 [Streptomyces minutiscleroticus]